MRRVNIVDGVVLNIAEVAGNAVPEWMQDWAAYEEGMAVGKPWPRDEVADAAEADLARRRQILAELAALDRFLPRSVEDLLDAGVIQLARTCPWKTRTAGRKSWPCGTNWRGWGALMTDEFDRVSRLEVMYPPLPSCLLAITHKR